MNATTMMFTLWLGTAQLDGRGNVFVGRALVSDQIDDIGLVRPTMDADFQVEIVSTDNAAEGIGT